MVQGIIHFCCDETIVGDGNLMLYPNAFVSIDLRSLQLYAVDRTLS
jgi:hypothetical protein